MAFMIFKTVEVLISFTTTITSVWFDFLFDVPSSSSSITTTTGRSGINGTHGRCGVDGAGSVTELTITVMIIFTVRGHRHG